MLADPILYLSRVSVRTVTSPSAIKNKTLAYRTRFIEHLLRSTYAPHAAGSYIVVREAPQKEPAYETLNARPVDQPLLLFRSAVDHVVEASNAAWILSHVRSADVTERVLPNSYHVATLDNDAPQIVAGSLELIRRLAPAAAGA